MRIDHVGLALITGSFLSACDPVSGTVQAAEVQSAGRLLLLAGDDPIRSYSWEGREILLHHGSERLWAEFGRLGWTEDTLLYLPLDEGPEGGPFPGAGGIDLGLEGAGCTWTEGRFGAAVSLSPGARLELRSDFRLPADAFTVQLWVRPDPGLGRSTILHVPDRLRIGTSSELHVEVSIPGLRKGDLLSAEPLRMDAWNAIGIAFSAEPVPQLRAVVNGASMGDLLSQAPPHEPGDRLVLGGAQSEPFAGSIDELRIRHYGATTSELRADGAPVPGPGMHEVLVRRSSGDERLETWIGVHTAPVVSGTALETAELEHVALRGGRLRWVPGHWTQLHPVRRPMARTALPLVYIGDHRVLLFGGETRDTDLPPMRNTADTWIFHTDSGTWEEIETEHAPAPRCHQDADYSPDHGLVFLLGGFKNDAPREEEPRFDVWDDMWTYDVAARDWRQVTPLGYLPARSANDAVVYDPERRSFLVVTAAGMRLWSPDEGVWIKVPRPRLHDASGADLGVFSFMQSHVCGLDPKTGKLLVFGGERMKPERRITNDTYSYDLETNTMVRLECPDAPAPRTRPGFAYDSKRGYFVLFGGSVDQATRLGDLWRFLPEEGRWERLDASNAPSARGGCYKMPYDPELDEFFLLCGRTDLTHFLNESWKLHLDDRAVGRAAYVFARDGLAAGSSWKLRAETPGDSRISVRFRFSPDNAHWGEWQTSFEGFPRREDRFVLAELSLHPGSKGEAPEVVSLGFVRGELSMR